MGGADVSSQTGYMESVRSLFSAVAPLVKRRRSRAQIEAAMEGKLDAAFRAQLPGIERWAVARLHAAKPPLKVWMRVEKDDPFDFDALAEDLTGLLTEAGVSGSVFAAGEMGLDWESAPPRALAYARDRAAELVGRTWAGDTLIENPNPEFAITDTLRDRINELVAQAIDEGWTGADLKQALQDEAFSAWRAETIARTETAIAYNKGALAYYKDNGIERVRVLDGAGCLPEGHEDGAGGPSDAEGVQDDAEANGQVWTADEADELETGHPNCIRSFAPETGIPFDTGTPIEEEETE